jgi:general secretion pathway protein L
MTMIVTRFPAHEFDNPTVWRVVDGQWIDQGTLSDFVAVGDEATVMAIVAPADTRCTWTSLPDLEPKQAEGVARIRAAEQSLGNIHAVARYIGEDSVVTATIAPAVMEQGLARLMLSGINPDIVVPMGLMVEAIPDGVRRGEFDGTTALRGPAFAIPDEPVFRDLLVGNLPVEDVHPEAMRAMLLAASERPLLNLRKGIFAKRVRAEWLTAEQRKWILRLIGALVAASLLLGLVTWAKHKNATSAENDRALSVAQKIDPSIQDIDQAEAALDRALVQKGMAKGRFAPLSAGLWRSVQSSPNVTVRELRYGAGGILTVVLAAPDSNSVNVALIKIQQDGYRVTATPRQDTSGATLVDLTMRMP